MKKPFKKPRKLWTPEEVEYLVGNYGSTTNKSLADYFDRTVGSIEVKAKQLDLKKDEEHIGKANRKWSDEDIDFLKTNYGKLTAREIASHLDKKLYMIQRMAHHYNLTNSKDPSKSRANSRRNWLPQEVEYLIDHYQVTEQKEMALHLGRPLASIQKKMEYLGLKKYDRSGNWSPRDTEYLDAHYELTPMDVMTTYLGRSIGAIKVKACERGLSRDVATYIEREVQIILQQLGIPFKAQETVRGFVADFKLADNKLIEVHGDYWHCNPRIYPEPKNEIQKAKVRIDKVKHQVYTKLGYDVLYIWELELNENRAEVVERIKQFAVQG